jgi:transposase InsO family protein
VGERSDEQVSVARFIADQRTFYRVPYAVCCAILGVSVSWLYKWLDRPAAARQQRRGELDAEVLKLFKASKGTYGSPRIHADLLEAGWTISVNTVADSMRRHGLQGRKPKHSKGLTGQDKKAAKFPDLLRRDFTATGPNMKWCGDMTEIPTEEGKLYMATVLDLFSRRLLACPTSEHPNADLACDAIKIAAAAPRRTRQHRRRDLPHRPRLDLHREQFHLAVQGQTRDSAVDGPSRFVFRQRRRGVVLLHPGARGPVPAPVHHQGRGAGHRRRLVPRVLQRQTQAQLGGIDVTDRIREDHR